jgi:ribonuclease P protein component
VAFAIGRKVGNAVVRNRIRRRLRTLLRESVPDLRPGAWLVAVSPAAAGLTYGELETSLHEAVARASTSTGRHAPRVGARS